MINLSSAICVAALFSLVTSVSADNTKKCPSFAHEQLRCALPNGNEIELTWRQRAYITLECHDRASYSCSELPKVSHTSAPPTRVMIENCVLPANESLSCTLQALGAPDASLLTLRNVHSLLKSEHTQGLLISELNLEGPTSEDYGSLPTAALANLPLRILKINDARLSLTSDSLTGVSKLEHLELSNCEIKGLNESVFRELKSLITLNLWHNGLRELPNGTFDGLHSLASLDLSNNPLHSLGDGILAAARKLRELRLIRTELAELKERTLRNLTALKTLIISDVSNRLEVGSRALSLQKLQMVHIEHCRNLSLLSGDALAGARELQSLSLSHNGLEALPPGLLEDSTGLRALNLSNNGLRSLDAALFAGLWKLEQLNLNDNLLEVFSSSLFEPLSMLRDLSARNNRLGTLSPAAFKGLLELRNLDLAHNELTCEEINDDDDEERVSAMHELRKLRRLDLSHNHIKYVFDDWRKFMIHLELLNLTNNAIEILKDRDTNFVSEDVTVDLRCNQISVIEIDEEEQFARVDLTVTGKGSLLLDGNPFHCDCRTYTLLQLLTDSNYAYISPALKLGAATCATPPALANTAVLAAPLDKLTCELLAPNCPDRCNCNLHPARYAVELDCNQPPDNLPSPDQFKLNRTVLRLRRAPLTFNLSRPVHELILSGLGLTRLPPGLPPPGLELLDLTDNLMTEAPIASGYSLRLAGNPLACDCAHYDSLNSLLRSTNIEDWNDVTCAGGRFLKHINDADALCAEDHAAWAGRIGGALAALGLVAVVAAISWLRYRNEIKVYLFARGWCGCITRSGEEAPAIYDVFLSFSHKDEDLVVRELVPELERRGYRLCVHYRDWAPGETIAEHVERSVGAARRTLVVVSEGFCGSEWARAEFRAAHARALREGRTRVIVVLLGDPPDTEDDELRTYLRTNTYLKWGDPWFWKKLQYALPHRPLGLLEDVELKEEIPLMPVTHPL